MVKIVKNHSGKTRETADDNYYRNNPKRSSPFGKLLYISRVASKLIGNVQAAES
jgi:hypothetical protein